MAVPAVTASSATNSSGSVPGTARKVRGRASAGDVLNSIAFYAFVCFFIAFCVAPFVWTFITSLKSPQAVFKSPTDTLPPSSS